ncbi:MAG TPA: PsbP-related protein [Actinomycetota bacterium]|nr:PsbP-related protein [Actinomycetota bacterium]
MATQDTGIPADNKARKFDRNRLLVVLAVVAVGIGIFLFANRSQEPAAKGEQEPEFFRIEFPDHRFSIRLPGDWEVFQPERQDPQIVLVAGVSGTQNNVRIRVSPLPQPVTITDTTPDSVVAEFQALFDGYIDQGEGVKEVIQRQRVKVDGLHGWQYLYTFTDTQTGEEGMHSHIFLLGGTRMYVIVFQALPTSNYGVMADTFDEIITSFEVMDSEQPTPSPSAS